MNTKKFKQSQYDKLTKHFNNIAKKIKNYETRALPQDENWIGDTISDLTDTLNRIKSFITLCYSEFTERKKTEFRVALEGFEKKYIARLAVLHRTVDLPDLFSEIDINLVREIPSESASNISLQYIETEIEEEEEECEEEEESGSEDSDTDAGCKDSFESQSSLEKTNNVSQIASTATSGLTVETTSNTATISNPLISLPGQQISSNLDRIETNMALDKAGFLALMAANIRKNYDGNPLGLQSFLATIDLLKDMAGGSADLLVSLKKFVLTKLEGYASEVIPENPENIDVIVNILREKIKHESSEVIEGRMMTLRADRNN